MKAAGNRSKAGPGIRYEDRGLPRLFQDHLAKGRERKNQRERKQQQENQTIYLGDGFVGYPIAHRKEPERSMRWAQGWSITEEWIQRVGARGET